MKPCIYCTEKHVGKARTFFMEALAGYPGRIGMCVGELAAAEEEAPDDALRAKLRAIRKQLEVRRKKADVDWEQLLESIDQKMGAVDEPPKTVAGDDPDCSPCKKARLARAAAKRSGRPFIIATTFSSFDQSYSLVGVVLDQARAASRAGYAVTVLVMDTARVNKVPEDVAQDPAIAIVPFFQTRSVSEDNQAQEISQKLLAFLSLAGEGVLIAHDLLFQEHFEMYAKAFHLLGDVPGWNIFHTAHSAPGDEPRTEENECRRTVPEGQSLISLSASNCEGFLEYYRTEPSRVHVLPNPRDLTTQLSMTKRVAETVYDLGLYEADVVQIYPYSATRTYAKGVHKLIKLFGSLAKNAGVKLLLVDAHATDKRSERERQHLEALVEEHGLSGQVFWMSDRLGAGSKYHGISSSEVSQLMLVSNLFVFPTTSEGCPLVLLEAAQAGCLLVTNTSVPALHDVVPLGDVMSFPFGTDPGADINYDQAAEVILKALDASPANRTKRLCLRRHNLQAYAESLKALENGELVYRRGWEEAP